MMKFNKENMGEYLYSRLPSYHRTMDEQNSLLLKRFLEVMNESFQWNNSELDRVLSLAQASNCPEENLEDLAHSMGADWISTIHPKYQRKIISMLVKLYQQKGTIDTIRFIASELSGFEARIVEGQLPEEYRVEGDEKKRLFTVRLEAPDLDDPVLAQQNESTISEVISKFIPVHSKFILVVTYFHNEPFERKFTYLDTVFLKDDKGLESKSYLGEMPVSDKIKYLYNQDSKFSMLNTQDDWGVTNDPYYKTVNNLGIWGVKYDDLYSTKIIRLDTYTKSFNTEPTKTEFIRSLYGVESKGVVINTITTKSDKVGYLDKFSSDFNILGTEAVHTAKVVTQYVEGYDREVLEEILKAEFIKTIDSHNKSMTMDTNVSENSKIVVNYILEGYHNYDLGIDTCIMQTNNLSCLTVAPNIRMSTYSGKDKITKGSNITYLYD